MLPDSKARWLSADRCDVAVVADAFLKIDRSLAFPVGFNNTRLLDG